MVSELVVSSTEDGLVTDVLLFSSDIELLVIDYWEALLLPAGRRQSTAALGQSVI